MSDPFIGEIRSFGFNFAPRGWAFCAGQLLSISQNTALFSLLGTTYGGNGTTTFALPDLRGRSALHAGSGPGLSAYALGEVTGQETETVLTTQMPSHTHVVSISTNTVPNPHLSSVPAAGNWASEYEDIGSTQFLKMYKPPPAGVPVTMAPQTLGLTGGGQPHANQQPYLTVNYCICMNGVFPARN